MQSGTRMRVHARLSGIVRVTQSDIELLFDDGAGADGVWIANRIGRVAVRGGTFGGIEVQIPGTYYPSEEWHREWRTTDVLVDRVRVTAGDTAFLMRGLVRAAITNSWSYAERYSVWFGDTADFENEDVILAGNDFYSVGPEATVRLVHVVRSVTVENRLENTEKHNYRTHGRARDNYASRNILVGTGAFLGRLPDDHIGRQWFDDNTFYHTAPSLFEWDDNCPVMYFRRNVAYTNVWQCFICRTMPGGWIDEMNVIRPYQPGPARRP